jgi:hypothetical protein
MRISARRHERHTYLIGFLEGFARQQFRLELLERWKAGDNCRRIVLRGHQVKKGLPVLFKEYPVGKARHRSRRQRCDELIKVSPVLRNLLRLHPVSMACDSHFVVLVILAWGGERGTGVDVQRLCLVSWKPRSTAWRSPRHSRGRSAGYGQDVGANAQVRRRSIRGRPLGNASSCT